MCSLFSSQPNCNELIEGSIATKQVHQFLLHFSDVKTFCHLIRKKTCNVYLLALTKGKMLTLPEEGFVGFWNPTIVNIICWVVHHIDQESDVPSIWPFVDETNNPATHHIILKIVEFLVQTTVQFKCHLSYRFSCF